jgi:hypothetical protein
VEEVKHVREGYLIIAKRGWSIPNVPSIYYSRQCEAVVALPVGEEERKGEGGVYSSQLPPRPSLASTFEPSHLIIAIHFYGSHNEAINYLNPNYFF